MPQRRTAVYDEAWEMIEFGLLRAARIIRDQSEFRQIAAAALEVFEFRWRNGSSEPDQNRDPSRGVDGSADVDDNDPHEVWDPELGLLLLSRGGHVLAGNDAWHALRAVSADEGGSPPLLSDVVAEPDRNILEEALQRIRDGESGASFTCHLLDGARTPHHVRMQICAYPWQQAPIPAFLHAAFARVPHEAVVNAIKRARRTAHEHQRSRDAVLTSLNHELRTPLNGILGSLQGLKVDLEESEHRETIDCALRAARRLSRTLLALLHLADIEGARIVPRMRLCNITAILAKVTALHKSRAHEKGISMVAEHPDDPCIIAADPDHLAEALGYLMDNAVKFSSSGTIRTTIRRVDHARTDERCVQIVITDEGIGIPLGQIGVVQQPFRQASEGYTRLYEGTGLGLTIARRLVELMHGSLDMESIEGKGTTIVISFPADAVPSGSVMTSASSTDTEQGPHSTADPVW